MSGRATPRAALLLAALALGACGLDGPPTRPGAEPEPAGAEEAGVTVGVSGSIGAVIRP